jgi:hypothetical protein
MVTVMIGRDDSRAALPGTDGAGSQRLQALANEALERAGVPLWCDPLRIAIGLGKMVRAAMRAEERATLDADCINYLWVAGEPRETGLNVFVGDALAVFADAGFPKPSPADVTLLAGFLALPALDVPTDLELTLQEHAPVWFLREHQRRRRWNRSSDSGVFTAVNR